MGFTLTCRRSRTLLSNDRVSRTQYQYTLVNPNTALNDWTNRFVAHSKSFLDLEDVATDQETGAQAIQLTIDRVTASRLGIAPTTIDQDALRRVWPAPDQYAFYTQLNQYHVVMETYRMAEGSQQTPGSLHSGQRGHRHIRSGCNHNLFTIGVAIRRLQCPHFIGEVHHIGGKSYRTGDGSVRNLNRNRCQYSK